MHGSQNTASSAWTLSPTIKMNKYFCTIFILQGLSSVIMSVTLVGNPLAIQGQDYKLTCNRTNISPSAEMDWYKDGIKVAVTCAPLVGLCAPSSLGRYSFTTDSNGMYIHITSLRRSEDQRLWKCTYKAEGSPLEEDTMNLTIFTIPSGLIYTQEPTSSSDLSLSAVTLQCVTSSCIYPVPVINWYYKDPSPPSLATLYKTTGTQTAEANCTSPENISSSRLELLQNTAWSDNSNKTVTFSCGIEYPRPLGTVYSKDSFTITFAIRVSWVQMRQNSTTLANTTLVVTAGDPITLNCVTGTSRPDPTIEWFIENERKGSGANFTFIPADTDHDKTIYCRAYNTNPNIPVESAKPRMFVRVRVTNVTLQGNGNGVLNGTLIVTSEQSTTLTCVTGTSRPPAVIEWYFRSQMMGNETSLTFTPANKDHDTDIYCQAYNIDPSKPVISIKQRLFVKVIVSNVTFLDSSSGTMVFYEGYPKTLKCISSPSRPVSSITWWFESQSGTILLTNNITNTEEPAIDGLHKRISEITLTLMKDSRNKKIFCNGNIDGQQPSAVSPKVNVDVWYPPHVIVESVNGSYTEKGLLIKCSAHGVPERYAFRLIHSSLYSGIKIRQLSFDYISTGTIIYQFASPTYMDTGIYTCTVSNGIPEYEEGSMDKSANGTVWIRDIPWVTSIDRSFYAENGHSGRLVIELFSSLLEPQVIWYKHNSSTLNKLQSSEKYNILLSSTLVNVGFYSVTILQPGYIATLEVKNITRDDFGSFQVQVKNSVGEMSPLILILKATASEPQDTSHNGPDGALLGGVLGSAVLVSIVVAVVGVILYRRRNKYHDHQSRKEGTSNREHDVVQNRKREEEHYQELEIIEGQVDEKNQIRSAGSPVYQTLAAYDNIREHEYSHLKNTSG